MILQEPLELNEIKLHLRLDVSGTENDNLEDGQLMALAKAARSAAESYTALSIAQQNKTIKRMAFPTNGLNLKTWPVTEVTSITYLDESGNTQEFTDFILDNEARPAVIYPIDSWPSAKYQANSVQIDLKAGFTDGLSPNPNPIPEALKQAMLLITGHLYANRESVSYGQAYEVPMGAAYLMNPHRIEMGM